MSDAAPPPWVKSAPGLSAAHKFMLSTLWGYGPYNREELWVIIDGDRQPRAPARCWESCEELAELTDQKVPTVRSQLRKLRDDGWFEPGKGSMRTLAWGAPGVFAYGAGVKALPQGVTGYPGDSSTPMGEQVTPRGDSFTPRGVNALPQTLQERSNSTSNKLEDARPTSGKPASATRSLDTRLPAMQPSVHTPQLPAESAAHDRNTDTRTPPHRRDDEPSHTTRRRGGAQDAPGVDHRDVKPDNPRSQEPPEQFELIPPSGGQPPADSATPAKIRAWWDEVYVPLRAETLDAYRPGSAKLIRCSDSRLAAIRARLADACPGDPWSKQRECLTHVVRNAAARVHEHRGKQTSWDWNSLDAIQPKHWLLIEKQFAKYHEALAAYASGIVQGPDEFRWMRPRAANQVKLSDVTPEERDRR